MSSKSTGHLLVLTLVLMTALCRNTWAAEPAATDATSKGPSSEVVNGITGRLVLPKATFTEGEWIPLLLEIANRTRSPVTIETGNPFIVSLYVTGVAGKPIDPTVTRIDIGYAPQEIVIPPESNLGFPITIDRQDSPAGIMIHATTRGWKLLPGKYKISGEYLESKTMILRKKAANEILSPWWWRGRLTLPPVEIEVRPKE